MLLCLKPSPHRALNTIVLKSPLSLYVPYSLSISISIISNYLACRASDIGTKLKT